MCFDKQMQVCACNVRHICCKTVKAWLYWPMSEGWLRGAAAAWSTSGAGGAPCKHTGSHWWRWRAAGSHCRGVMTGGTAIATQRSLFTGVTCRGPDVELSSSVAIWWWRTLLRNKSSLTSVMRGHLAKLHSWAHVSLRPVRACCCATPPRTLTDASFQQCTQEQQRQMNAYLELVLDANQHMNLTGAAVCCVAQHTSACCP